MRIAYLTGEYPRVTDTFIQREVAALRDLGVEVQTFAIRRPASRETTGREQETERACTFYILPPRFFTALRSHATFLLRHPARYFGALALAIRTSPPGWRGMLYQLFYFTEAAILARELTNRAIDHLHNHFANSSCSVAMLASHLSGVPFSFTMHGPAIFFEPMRWRIDEKIRRARFVCCISHFCRSQAMIFAPPDTWERLNIVHCGVDPTRYNPVKHRGPGRHLLFVGRLAAVKGLPVLLDALRTVRIRHPDVELTVVGDGPDRSALEKQTRDIGLAGHVRFVGYRSQDQVREHLSQTDVFVMASFAEGVPVVLMEALAAGVPVVATRIAGVGELVEDRVNGFTVAPGDAVSLAERITNLLDDPETRTRFGQAGRRHVEQHYNVRHEAARLLQILTASRNSCPAPESSRSQTVAPDIQPRSIPEYAR